MYSKKWECKVGEFYDISHYDTIINETSYGFNDKGETLFCLIKGAIKPENRKKYADIIIVEPLRDLVI